MGRPGKIFVPLTINRNSLSPPRSRIRPLNALLNRNVFIFKSCVTRTKIFFHSKYSFNVQMEVVKYLIFWAIHRNFIFGTT